MREQNIEQLFRNGLGNLEAEVNPNAWTNIAKGLQAPAPSNHVPDGSPASKTIGLWGYAGLFLGISAVVITAVIYSPEKKSSDSVAAVKNPPSLVQENSTPVAAKPAELKMIDAPAAVNVSAEKENAIAKNSEQKSIAINDAAENSENIKQKETVLNTPPVIVPVKVQGAVNSQAKNTVAVKSITPENNSAPENTAAVSSNPQNANTDFNLLVEPSESTPREAEVRTDFKFFVPSAFSPDGDGNNEDFYPMGINFKDYQVVIYKREGKEVFRSNDISNKWNGRLKDGTPAPADLYAYFINVKDLNNVEHPQQGSILLKR